jgi:hypothetical protein
MRASRRVPVTGKCLVAPVAAATLLLFGCRSLDRFDTKGDPAYCGRIVGVDVFQDAFIPENTRPKLGLHLELDPDKLTTYPGTLTSNDGEFGLCSASGAPLFRDSRLRAIEEIFHDALSQAEFGDGHQHDFFAWVDSTCQGTMLSVVSLLTDGAVEVRLFKPAADPPEGASAEERPGFAKFHLTRNEAGCSY